MMSGKTILAALLLLTALFSGCAGEEQVYEGKSYAIEAEKIQGILIDVRDRRIEVSASEDDRIYIDYFESEENGYDIQVSEESLLSITGRKEEGFSGYFGLRLSGEESKILVRISEKTLSRLNLSTTNEDIRIDASLSAESVCLANNNGDISFDLLDIGAELDLENKNGDIRGTLSGSDHQYAISAVCKKGRSNLPENKEGGEKTLHVRNNNGDIDISFTEE